jgi:hypothetical protein
VEPALHRAHRNAENAGSIAVLQPPLIDELERLAQQLWQLLDRGPNRGPSLLPLDHGVGGRFATDHRLGQRAAVAARPGGPVEAHPAMPRILAVGVDRLPHCDGVEPRAERAAGLEPAAVAMHLEKRGLEHVLGQLAAMQVAVQEGEEIPLAAVHEHREGGRIVVAADP